MKFLTLTFVLCFLIKISVAQSTMSSMLDRLSESDTLYVNFCVGAGEFASIHRGLMVYKKDNVLLCKYVLYKYGVSLLPNKLIEIESDVKAVPLQSDSIVKFYDVAKTNYFVMKNEWKLDKKQVLYLKDYFSELEKFKSKGFSNAPDFYTVMSSEKSFVVLDLRGKWDKFSEVKKVMNL